MSRMERRRAWSVRQWLLIAGFAICGLLAWWQLHTHSPESPIQPRARLPDHVVTNFSGMETNASGQPNRRFAAAELRHFVTENLSEIDQPRVELLQPDGVIWTAQSATGLIFANGDQMRLLGDVQVERHGSQQVRAARLRTAQLDLWRKRELAVSTEPVRIDSEGDTLTANGMQLWYGAPRRTVFQGRTRIQFAPPKNHVEQGVTAP
ncbi:LPS export ABC transporter periplasmic protein LptC [Chromatium weissei]|nr:LPS export ABC transporter periplasmic protein LptC [Chromatium weissei]